MTYFEHTKADLARERAAGIVETRQEIGEQILALIDDTARKMNGETAENPDAEREYDRGYLMEDLLTRLANFAGNFVPDAETLFPSVMDGRRVRPAYPLLIEGQEPERIGEITKEMRSGVADYETARGTAKVVPLRVAQETIRQAHNAMTFDGYPRHPFEGDGFECDAVVYRVIDREGSRKTCGEHVTNAVHDWRF